jgi:methionyl-tRNA formyltransferase
MKTTKVIFFGTSDRSLPILESLKDNFNLCLCVTKQNSKIGRKQIEKETEVKSWSKKNNIDFIEIGSLKSQDLENVINKLEEISPDYVVVADFSFIIPKKIIDTVKGNIINIHFSLLPKYRGASPVQFAILNGDEVTGITYYLLDEGMDTGKIISQIEYKLDTKYTSGELYQILFNLAAENLPQVIKNMAENKIILENQDESLATYTISKTNPKHTFIFKEDALINWQNSPEEIERSIRAYNPWPISWTYLKNIEDNRKLDEEIKLKNHVDKNLKVKIYSSDAVNEKLKIKNLQVEGKSKITWEEFKNGYTL